MTATLKNLLQGQAVRTAMLEALAAAGPAGLSSAELAAACGVKSDTTLRYHARIAAARVQGHERCGRWWHPDHIAAAQAWMDGRQDELARERGSRCRFAEQRLEQAFAAVVAAGDGGASIAQIAAAIGVQPPITGAILGALAKAGKIQRAQVTGTQLRYVRLGAPVPSRLRPKREVEREQARQAKSPAKAVKRAVAAIVRASNAKAPPKAARAVWGAAEADTSRAKVVVCPGFRGSRYEVERVEPFFSGMQVGSYLRTGSAVERAYAGGAA